MGDGKVTLVFGRKGKGKSYYCKREADKLGRHSPLVVWDPNDEWAGPRARDAIRDAEVFSSLESFAQAQASQGCHRGRAVIQAHESRFPAFCRYCCRAGGLTVVVDELHLLVSPSSAPQEFRDLLLRCRHHRLNVTVASWRPTSLPTFLRQAADRVVAFQTREPTDLDWYRDVCGKEFAESLPGLKGHAMRVFEV